MALTNFTNVQTLGIGSNIEVVGVITTGQFKSGTSNLHSSGVELTNLNVSGIATIGGNLSIGGTLTYQDVTNIDSVGLITARSGINVSGGQLDVGSNIKIGNAGVITATSFVGSGANLTSLPAQATIANNADNRIITGGSGVNLNAESNVLYDGTNFGIGKSPSRTLDVQGKIRSSDSICFGDNSSTPSEGAAIHRPAASSLAFVTNNTERIRIKSNGYVGIGTNNPQRPFVISNSGAAGVEFNIPDGNGGLSFNLYNRVTTGYDPLTFNANYFVFSPNATEKFRIGSTGAFGLSGANYGTSGQVLTSAGSGSAPAWKGGGGLQVLEQFSSPADGSSFATSKGTVTVQNPTDWQALNTSLNDAQGSVITYQPPDGTVQVIYEFQYHIASDTDSNAILGARLLWDGQEITHSRFGQRGGTNYFDQLNTFKWTFNIGGSTDYSVGRLASWTSGKVIKLQMSEYNSSYEFAINLLRNYGSSGAINVFRRPIISITAIGTPS